MKHSGIFLVLIAQACGVACSSGASDQTGAQASGENALMQPHHAEWDLDDNRCFAVTDVGTLVAGHSMGPTGVNDRGMVSGQVSGPPPSSRHGVLWSDGVLTDLGVKTNTSAINHHGAIAGSTRLDDGNRRATLFRQGETIDLGTLPGDTASDALALDDRGHVVGQSGSRAFIWHHGEIRALETPTGAVSSAATQINERGQVLGDWSDEKHHHGFLWEDGESVDLGSFGGDTYAFALNRRGEVAGASDDGQGNSHAFVWRRGELVDLGVGAGIRSFAEGINDDGDAAATWVGADQIGHAFVWLNGEAIELGTLGGKASRAFGISNDGLVIGRSDTADGGMSAFVWRRGTMRELPHPAGATRVQAFLINTDTNVIAGTYVDSTHLSRMLVWTPERCRHDHE